jgi:hypothetical protein
MANNAVDMVINSMNQTSKTEESLSPPDDKSFRNFLAIGLADHVFGGSMDPEKGSSWRSGEGLQDAYKRPLKDMDLKDYTIRSGGKSKELYAKELSINPEDVQVDTMSYRDKTNYEFNIGTVDNPNMKHEKSSGSSTGWKGMDSTVDSYIDSYMKREHKGDPFGAMDDERVDSYKRMYALSKKLMNEGGASAVIEKWPHLKKKFDKYQEAFGSE